MILSKLTSGNFIQQYVLAGVFLGIGFQTSLIGFVADLLAVNRKLLEEVRYRTNATGLSSVSNPIGNKEIKD